MTKPGFRQQVAVVVALSHIWLTAAIAQPINYQPFVVSSFAGPTNIATIDGTNTDARFYFPQGVAIDKSTNLYVAEASCIRKITSNGVVTTIAGAPGLFGTSDGTNADARFNSLVGVVVDSSNNVFVADSLNNTIRKIDTNGVVMTFAGQPQSFPFYQNGTGTAARFWQPTGLAIDANNYIYVADYANCNIRLINPAASVSLFAGGGFPAPSPGTNDGNTSSARFSYPNGVAVISNIVFVADSGNHTIRKIAGGTVSTLAGSPTLRGNADGAGAAARFANPFALAVDRNTNLFVADTGNNLIRKVTSTGLVTTVAGLRGNGGGLDGPTNIALFNSPMAICVSSAGTLFVSEYGNSAIRSIASAIVSTFAGPSGTTVAGANDGLVSNARFFQPYGIAASPAGNLYIADTRNFTIRQIAPDASVITLAGSPGVKGGTDGTNSSALFYLPYGVAVGSDETVYVSDHGNHTIRKITSDGLVSTWAGLAGASGSNDGTNNSARFIFPNGVAVDLSNNVYVADGARTVRKITPDGVVTTIAGKASQTGSTDGTNSVARFADVWGIVTDTNFNIYVTDRINYSIRKITPDYVVTTFAGLSGSAGFIDGVSTNARFNLPTGIAIDSRGNLYVSDTYYFGYAIRKITPEATVTTIAGAPDGSFGDVDGAIPNVRLYGPFSLAVDANDTLYIADSYNHAIRRAVPLALRLTLQSEQARISWPAGSDYQLEQCSPLGETWSPVTAEVQTNDSTLNVFQPFNDQMYYRLRSP